MKQYPNLRVELVPFENEKVVEADIISHLGNEGLVDIMLTTYDENFLIEKKCTALKLTDLSLSIAMSLNHRLANKRQINHRRYSSRKRISLINEPRPCQRL